ncbi:MAG: DUF5990 family protein [Streptosporangiaceae bacterium]
MQIRIEGTDLPGRSCGASLDFPGYDNIHVGLQRRAKRDELLGLTPGDAPAAQWTIDCHVTDTEAGRDVRGPWVQGPPGGRFIYLSWGTVDASGVFTLFRRAKLWLDGVAPAVLEDAVRTSVLVGRLGLTDAKGHPTCTAGRPPTIEWSADPG